MTVTYIGLHPGSRTSAAYSHNDVFWLHNTVSLTDAIKYQSKTSSELVYNSTQKVVIAVGPAYCVIFSAKNMSTKIKDTIRIGKMEMGECLYLGVGMSMGDWNKVGELYAEQRPSWKTIDRISLFLYLSRTSCILSRTCRTSWWSGIRRYTGKRWIHKRKRYLLFPAASLACPPKL